MTKSIKDDKYVGFCKPVQQRLPPCKQEGTCQQHPGFHPKKMIFADRVENLSFQESVLCAYLENCSIDIDEGN